MNGKGRVFLALVMLPVPWMAGGQECDPASSPQWRHAAEAYLYFMPDDFIFLPVYSADRGWLHLEGRYNYEDVNTLSAWFGYNFPGGRTFQYSITPMIGGVAGNTSGLGAGLELTFDFSGFGFYSESEFVFDLENAEDGFFYNWTDFTYSPLDWLWFGLSAQRTRLYRTDPEIQRGLLIGGGSESLGVNGYVYDPGSDDPYFILSLEVGLPG